MNEPSLASLFFRHGRSGAWAGAIAPLFFLLILLMRSAALAAVCDASQICAPDEDPCVIDTTYEIEEDCVLDFGSRTLTLTGAGSLKFEGVSLSILAGELVLESGGVLDGDGKGDGGSVFITLIDGLESSGKIDVSSDVTVGTNEVWAGGNVVLDGNTWYANNENADTSDGTIHLVSSAGAISIGTVLDASGGSAAAGGDIELEAEGRIDIQSKLDVGGGEFDGGSISVESSNDIVLGAVSLIANGGGSGGYGGNVTINAGADLSSEATIKANGSSTGGDWSGDGAYIDLTAAGTLFLIDGDIKAKVSIHRGN